MHLFIDNEQRERGDDNLLKIIFRRRHINK